MIGTPRPFVPVLLVLFLAACASTHAKQFIGQDVREVVLVDGGPANAFDYGKGQRVFQFYWEGGTVATPSTTTGYVNPATGYFSSTTIGGGTYSSAGCLINYFTRWDESRQGWIVYDVSWPSRLVC